MVSHNIADLSSKAQGLMTKITSFVQPFTSSMGTDSVNQIDMLAAQLPSRESPEVDNAEQIFARAVAAKKVWEMVSEIPDKATKLQIMKAKLGPDDFENVSKLVEISAHSSSGLSFAEFAWGMNDNKAFVFDTDTMSLPEESPAVVPVRRSSSISLTGLSLSRATSQSGAGSVSASNVSDYSTSASVGGKERDRDVAAGGVGYPVSPTSPSSAAGRPPSVTHSSPSAASAERRASSIERLASNQSAASMASMVSNASTNTVNTCNTSSTNGHSHKPHGPAAQSSPE